MRNISIVIEFGKKTYALRFLLKSLKEVPHFFPPWVTFVVCLLLRFYFHYFLSFLYSYIFHYL